MRRNRKPTKHSRSRSKKAQSGLVARTRKRQRINDARLGRGLRVLSRTDDIAAAARAIRVSVERFKRAARRRAAIRKQKGVWTVVRRLPRKMPIFSNGRQLAIKVNSKSAALIGRYLSAVGRFLESNDPKHLAEFAGRSVKDLRGKTYVFETDPNVLYRLSSAGGEPFEELYRIII